jgi:arylsulfatase A-like enzyme
VHTVDLVATIAKLYGIPAPANIDGVPLKEVVE